MFEGERRAKRQAVGSEDLDLVSVFGRVDADEIVSVYEEALCLEFA